MSYPHITTPARPNNAALIFRKVSLILMLLNLPLPIIGVLYAFSTFNGGSDAATRGGIVLLSAVAAGFIGAAFWAILYLVMDYVTRRNRVVRKTSTKKVFAVLSLVSVLAGPVLALPAYYFGGSVFFPVVTLVLGFYGFYGFGLLWNLTGRSKVLVQRTPNPVHV